MKVIMNLENIKEACGDWLMTHRKLEDVDPGVIDLRDYDGAALDEATTAIWDEEDQ